MEPCPTQTKARNSEYVPHTPGRSPSNPWHRHPNTDPMDEEPLQTPSAQAQAQRPAPTEATSTVAASTRAGLSLAEDSFLILSARDGAVIRVAHWSPADAASLERPSSSEGTGASQPRHERRELKPSWKSIAPEPRPAHQRPRSIFSSKPNPAINILTAVFENSALEDLVADLL